MKRKDLIKKYLEFFESKKHRIIPSASLVPENDPTVLFTTAGMQPLVPYLLGEKHPLGKRLTDVQKCIRTIDIEEVGDTFHHTFFEMLGNWSLGDYFKKESIKWGFEFLTKKLKIPVEKLAITVFAGNKKISKDEEAAKIWEDCGVSKERIVYLKDNWWGPAGKTGPCGPDTEIFYWSSNGKKAPKKFDPKEETWVEIWNNVLMEYIKDERGNFKEALQKNIDTGMGVERTLAALNNIEDNYLTEVWKPIIEELQKVSGKKYSQKQREMRILADHLKAAVFIIADGTIPGNSEQGYVLRRLIRRAVQYSNELEIKQPLSKIAEVVFEIYSDYEEISKNKKTILEEINKEEDKFRLTLEKGLNKLNKCLKEKKKLCGKEAFLLYQSFGFPLEMLVEECKKQKANFSIKDFEKEKAKHQELSRTAAKGKFKSGLADNSEQTTKLHTAAHMLLAALRQVLKDDSISQKGSNITAERLRMDFSFSRKLNEEEITKIEDLVNAEIQKNCEVLREEMSPEKAKTEGAVGAFEKKYGDIVSVYTIGKFSKEICAGPHVKNTCELGHFKIKKQESCGAGIRRIKAVLG